MAGMVASSSTLTVVSGDGMSTQHSQLVTSPSITLELGPVSKKSVLPLEIKRQIAIVRIQRACRRWACRNLKHPRLERNVLVKRLKLEAIVIHGAWTMAIYMTMFLCLVGAIRTASSTKDHNSHKLLYERDFRISQSDVASLASHEDIFRHLRHMSQAGRSFQYASAEFSVDPARTMLIQGVQVLNQPIRHTSLRVQVDIVSFSFSAWVRVPRPEDDQKIGIIYRPFHKSIASDLYCWGWFYESHSREFKFGAHDAGAEGALQETVVVDLTSRATNSSNTAAGSINLEAVVVDRTSVSFWQNGHRLASVPLTRPVTDCLGTDFILADSTSLAVSKIELGNLVYHPKALTQEEMIEMVAYSASLTDIAYGRLVHVEASSQIEDIEHQDMSISTQNTMLQGVTQVKVAEMHSVMRNNMIQIPQEISSAVRPCYGSSEGHCTIEAVTAIQQICSTGNYFYDLLPVSNNSRVYMPTDYATTWDPQTFPEWFNQSVSFTWWIRSLGPMQGWLIMKQSALNSDRASFCWGIWTQNQGLYIARGNGSTNLFFSKTIQQNSGYNVEDSKIMRHFALVYNRTNQELLAYMDGVMFARQAGVEGFDDCGPNPQNYIGFGTRYPGNTHRREPSEIRDFRMYSSVALTPVEVGQIATEGRECKYEHMYQDAGLWSDIKGHGCEWYQHNSQIIPHLCDGAEVREQCPIACPKGRWCLPKDSGKNHSTSPHTVWNRIRRLKPNTAEGTICVATGINPWTECMSPKWTLGRDSLSAWTWLTGTLGSPKVDVTNCTVINLTTDNSCQFAAPRKVAHAISQTGGFTFSFWIKRAANSTTKFQPSIQIFSSMEPLVPLAELIWDRSGIGGVVWEYCNNSSAAESRIVLGITELPPDSWSMITIMSGNRLGESGKPKTAMAYNSQVSSVELGMHHCPPPSGDIIQGIAISEEVLISGLKIYAFRMNTQEVQLKYYKEKARMQTQTGPRITDKASQTTTFPIKQNTFLRPAVLLAPPLIQTPRWSGTDNCETEFARKFMKSVIPHEIQTICRSPRTCDSHEAVMRCRSSSAKAQHFGWPPDGAGKYIEFLFTVVEGDYIRRFATGYSDKETLKTSDFLDGLTRIAEVIFILYDASIGMTTRILVKVDLTFGSADVDVSMQHIQSVEGWWLGLSLVFCCLQFMACMANAPSMLRNYRLFASKIVLVVDILVTASVIVTTSLHMWHVIHSSTHVSKMLTDLTAIPWSDRRVPMGDKFVKWVDADTALITYMSFDVVMGRFRYLQLLTLLFRILVATRTHPRISILVKTVYSVADDLLHFFIVFFMIYLAFGVITWVQFGTSREGYTTFQKAFVGQYEMMHGVLPTYTGDLSFFAYTVVFNVLVFVLMINFLIALLVDGLAKAKRKINEDITEQEWLKDIVAAFHADVIKTRYWKWPHLSKIAKGLELQQAKKTVSINNLFVIDPTWKTKSIVAFLQHYGSFECLWPPAHRPAKEIHNLNEAIEELEDFLSFTIGTQRTSALTRKFQQQVTSSGVIKPTCNVSLRTTWSDKSSNAELTSTESQLDSETLTCAATSDIHAKVPKASELPNIDKQTRQVDVRQTCESELQMVIASAREALVRAQLEGLAAAEEKDRAHAVFSSSKERRIRAEQVATCNKEERGLLMKECQRAEEVWKHASQERHAISIEHVRAEKILEKIKRDRMMLCDEKLSLESSAFNLQLERQRIEGEKARLAKDRQHIQSQQTTDANQHSSRQPSRQPCNGKRDTQGEQEAGHLISQSSLTALTHKDGARASCWRHC